ncbi:MAG: RnfABCDGE type electron transport complex subunit D [Nitrospirae bacterium]|nr:RnfABCDGE type electron transport complex subunit D [Nitrospirota bacterium]
MEASDKKLIVAISPHIKDEETTARIMWTVSLALLPAFLMSAYYFGPRALMVTAVSVISCVVFEAMTQMILKRKVTVSDGSAFLTGLLLGLNLPSSLPLYQPVIGSMVAIVITKHLFGGLGYNIFNPALIGRTLMIVTWPKAMTTWHKPVASITSLDAVTTATPLGILKEEGMSKLVEVFGDKSDLYVSLFIGDRAGSLGETSVIALLLGAAFLFYRGYITWHIPFSFIATVVALTWIFGGKDALFTGDPILHFLSGGLVLGAFFMATDYVTCPTVRKAQIIFGIGCGALTALIRLKGGYPEGVMFAILIMNCFAPLLDRRFKTRTFGAKEQKQ